MTDQQLALLILQLVCSTVVLLYIASIRWKAREEQYKFRLYALRDKLIYLVSSGQLAENSLIFKVFYGALTKSIGEIDRVTLYSLVRASISAKTAIEQEKRERLQHAVDNASPQTREFVFEFAEAMMKIMIANSPALNLMLLVGHRCGSVLKFLRNHTIGQIRTRSEEVYYSYRYFEKMHSARA